MTEAVEDRPAQTAVATGIVVQNLTKTYRGRRVKALDGLSLTVKPGQAVGLVGPNGAGKTTFLSCLMGFLRYDSGDISIDGHAPEDMLSRRTVGYLPERLTFDRWMTGRDYMHYHHELAGRPESLRRRECEELLRRVELASESWAQPVKRYSRGMLQRLGFAQALLGNPRYLLLDEPASGMDPHGVLVVRNLLKELRKEGLTILLNSHQLDQIERSCDLVAFIDGGKVVRVEDLTEKKEEPQKLVIRFADSFVSSDGLSHEAFGTLTIKSSTELTEFAGHYARVTSPSQASTVGLIKHLVEAGFPIVEIRPEDSRLERLFMEQMGKREED